MSKSGKIVLYFPGSLVNQPIVDKLIKEYNLSFNILKAQILPDQEGVMVMELSGDKKDFDRGMRYLKNSGVNIQPLSKEISRDEEKCTHCGVCDLICPSGALSIVGERRELVFEADKCIACELCLEACPPGAMHLNF